MIPLMSLMIGCYIVTRMMIFLLRDDPQQSKAGIIINKVLAAGTVLVTITCVIFIFLSGISPLLDEDIVKPSEFSLNSKEIEASKKEKKLGEETEKFKEKQAYKDKVVIRSLKVASDFGFLGEIKNLGDRTLKEVEITIYFLDKNNKSIFEKIYRPVLVTEFSFSDNDPLKPNYSRKFAYYTTDDVPSEWAKKVNAKVTNIEFEK